MRLSKIGKVVKEARQCILCNTRERTGQEANLIQQWIGTGEAMYPVDENVRITEQGAAALMEMEGKDAEAVVWRSVGDGSELAEALKGIPARIDGAALAWKVCLKVEIQSGTVPGEGAGGRLHGLCVGSAAGTVQAQGKAAAHDAGGWEAGRICGVRRG